MAIAATTWFESGDGVKLFVRQWRPDGTAKGVLHIAHGLGEHGGRYERCVRALNTRGYAVFANDHRGHGSTALTLDGLGYFADSDGWNRVVEDLRLLIKAERKEYPGLPIMLLGHSMGSFMAQDFLMRHPSLIAGCILSGSNGKDILRVSALKALAFIERLRLGKRGRSRLMHLLALNIANKEFRPTRTLFDWLSRDTAEVDRFLADPTCGFVGTTQLWFDLLQGASAPGKTENLNRIPKDMPIYIFAGCRDPVGHNCKRLERLISVYRRAGLSNVSFKFYPEGRHEMLNEINRDEVTADLIDWLEKQTRRLDAAIQPQSKAPPRFQDSVK